MPHRNLRRPHHHFPGTPQAGGPAAHPIRYVGPPTLSIPLAAAPRRKTLQKAGGN